jgi:hypothetical protein
MFTFRLHEEPGISYGATIPVVAHRASHHHHADYFDQGDPSIYMLGLPKSHYRFGRWVVLTILAATVLALSVVVLGNLIF